LHQRKRKSCRRHSLSTLDRTILHLTKQRSLYDRRSGEEESNLRVARRISSPALLCTDSPLGLQIVALWGKLAVGQPAVREPIAGSEACPGFRERIPWPRINYAATLTTI
jgi:hypothetical protein